MSGIYIKGMEMPTSCSLCPFCFGANNICPWTREYATYKGRHERCPLVLVPDHGRLIDADALEYFADDSGVSGFDYVTRMRIRKAPTIIPAEEGEG